MRYAMRCDMTRGRAWRTRCACMPAPNHAHTGSFCSCSECECECGHAMTWSRRLPRLPRHAALLPTRRAKWRASCRQACSHLACSLACSQVESCLHGHRGVCVLPGVLQRTLPPPPPFATHIHPRPHTHLIRDVTCAQPVLEAPACQLSQPLSACLPCQVGLAAADAPGTCQDRTGSVLPTPVHMHACMREWAAGGSLPCTCLLLPGHAGCACWRC